MITREQCCCNDMFKAVSSINEVPINLAKIERNDGSVLYSFMMPFVDTYDTRRLEVFGEEEVSGVSYCPFCGEKIYSMYTDKVWEHMEYLCPVFLEWFIKNEDGKNFKAPTQMFKFDPKENKFYMHYRKGFGEGWIPVKYCIYCGEPLSEMIERHGLSPLIAYQLDPSEWQGKYKLSDDTFAWQVYDDVDGNLYAEDSYGNLQIEDQEVHWVNRFSPDGKIIGFLDPVTKEFTAATDPKEIKHWNKWFKNWKERNKHIKKDHIF